MSDTSPVDQLAGLSSGNGTVVDPWAVVPQLKKDVGTQIERARGADDVLTSFTKQADVINQRRESNLATKVAAEKTLNENINQDTQDFSAAVAPVNQRRVEIADRQAEIANMNPFKRMLLGMVSRGYNSDWLENQDHAAVGQLQAHAQQYQTLMGIHATAAKNIESTFSGQDSLDQLHLEDGEQQVSLAMKGVQSISQVVGAELQGISATQDVLRAQALKRQEVLGSLTSQQANQYWSQAKNAKDGIITVNGVPLHAGEIQEVAMNWQEKNLALQSRQVALAAGRLDLANAQEARAIAHMSAPEIDAAIKNGGQLGNGTRLNVEQLTRAYASQIQRNELIADQAANSGARAAYGSSLRMLGNTAAAQGGAARNLFGLAPPELDRNNQMLSGRVAQIAAGYQEAARGGEGAAQAYMQKQLPEIQKLIDHQTQMSVDMAKKWAGGDKDMERVAESWLTGQPLSAPAAAAGLIKMARNGVPPGTKLSPAAAASYQAVVGIVRKFDAGTAGDSIGALMNKNKVAKGQIDPALLSAVSQRIQTLYSDNMHDQTTLASPALAKNITDSNGQPHPFGNVSPHDFAASIAAGDAQGIAFVKQKTGMSEADAKDLFAHGQDSAAYQKYVKTHGSKGVDFGDLARGYNAVKINTMLTTMDHSPSAALTGGIKPSQAYVDILNNGEFQTRIQNAVAGQGRATAGDWMMYNAAGQGYMAKFFNYGAAVSQTAATMHAQDLQAQVARSERLRNTNPREAASIAVHTIDSIPEQDRNALFKEIDKRALAAAASTHSTSYADAFDSAIANARFQDPALERVRQAAARDFPSRHRNIYQGLSGMLTAASQWDPVASAGALYRGSSRMPLLPGPNMSIPGER